VMARGNRRETIFHDDDDRRFFLATLSEACAMTGWRVHAWVLMGNHYHLCIETPEANLVAGMSWLQNTVTRRYNVRHRAWGRLFGDRYKAVLVENALETDDGRAGVDREKTVNAQRSKREPAVAPVRSGENPIQAASRNTDFSQRGLEFDDLKVFCQDLHTDPISPRSPTSSAPSACWISAAA
jgi:REP element-mobilizing transposase RayT